MRRAVVNPYVMITAFMLIVLGVLPARAVAAGGRTSVATATWGVLQQGPPAATVVPHPRLLFGDADVQTLRLQALGTHASIWSPILAYNDRQRESYPPLFAPSAGDLDTYRTFGNQLIPLAFGCLITEDPDRCALAKTYLLTYAEWSQWGENEWRDLGHAHMLLGNALAYDWLHEFLSPAERSIVAGSLGVWAQKMYEASAAPADRADWNNWWRQSYMQNHFWTNNSALGIAGLALLDEDPRAQNWIDQATGQLAARAVASERH